MNTTASVQIANPFPGLRPFGKEDQHHFFGRESQVDTMIDKLGRTHFLAVIGASGSGKSSLVNCGLRPALHRGLMAKAGTSWRMAQFRPGGEPLKAMTRELAKEGVLYSSYKGAIPLEEILDTHLRLSKRGLIDAVQKARLPERANLLVVVDQFEELFRYRALGASAVGGGLERSQEAAAFVNLLLEAKTQANFRIYIVLTMRSDYLGDCAEFPGLPEAINQGQYLVPRMTREERKAAITGPARVGGGEISPVLLTRLVNDVGDNPDQLSILQHALNRTWARWEHEGRCEGPLDLPHYEAIGTMAHALDQHAEKAYSELESERQKKICEKIFKGLTDKGTDPRGIRRPTNLKTLCALAAASTAEVTQVVDVFREPSRSFLTLSPEVLEPDTVIDISHESLMRVWERLKKWAEEEAQSAQTYRRLSQSAALHAKGKESLWRDPGLQLALEWRGKEAPTEAWAGLYGGEFELAMGFLADSEAQRDEEVREKEDRQRRELQQAQALAAEQRQRAEEQTRAARRSRRWAFAIAALAVLASALFLFALKEGKEARVNYAELQQTNDKLQGKQAELQQTNDKLQQTNDKLQRETDRAEGQARLARSDQLSLFGIESRKIPFALQAALETYPVEKKVSPDVEGALRRVVRAQAIPLKRPGHIFPVTAVTFSPDGTRIATSAYDGIRMWDAQKGEELFHIAFSCNPQAGTVFSGDGKKVACYNSFGAGVWDSAGGWVFYESAPVMLVSGTSRSQYDFFQQFAFSSDGSLLAAALTSGSVKVWTIPGRQSSSSSSDSGKTFKGSKPVFSPNGKQLVTVVGDEVKIWDSESGAELLTLAVAETPVDGGPRNSLPINDVIFNPNGTQLATATGSEVKVWETSSGLNSETLKFQGPKVERVAFSPNGTYVAAGGGGSASIWDTSSGALKSTLSYTKTSTLSHLFFSPSGNELAIVVNPTTPTGDRIYLLNAISGESLQALPAATALAFGPDNKRAIARANSVQIEDASTRKLLTLWGRPEQMTAAAFGPNGKVATASSDGTLRLWNAESGRQLWVKSDLKAPITTVVFSQHRNLLVTAGDKDTPRLWDVTNGRLLQCLPKACEPPDKPVDAVAFSPDGTVVATAGEGGEVSFWNTSGADSQPQPLKVGGDIESLSFRSAEALAVASSTDTVSCAAPDAGMDQKRAAELKAGAGSATAGSTVGLWKLGLGKKFKESEKKLPDYEDQALAVKFSSDGQLMAVLGRNGVEVWHPDSNSKARARKVEGASGGFCYEAVLVKTGMAFSESGNLLATFGADHNILLWDTKSGEERPPLFNELPYAVSPPANVAFSRDGLLWIDHGWNVYRQPLGVEDLLAEAAVRVQGDRSSLSLDCRTYLHQDSCQQWATGMGYIAEGNKQAQQGDFEGAVDSFRQAQKEYPGLGALGFSPERQVSRLAASSMAVKLVWLVKQGKLGEAQALAEVMDAGQNPGEPWNTLCWQGSLRDYAAKVMDACEKAVALAPGNPDIHDSRGLARALTGNVNGAIEDFQFFTSHPDGKLNYEALKKKRQCWIDALGPGKKKPLEVFTPEVLKQLLSQ